jgi:hypothetical protein
VIAPLAGRNNVPGPSMLNAYSMPCTRKEFATFTEKRPSEGAPAARKTFSVPMSLRDSNRWSWALLICETRSVTGGGDRVLRRGICKGMIVRLSEDPFGRFFHPASGARMALGTRVPHPRSAPQRTRDGASGGATV